MKRIITLVLTLLLAAGLFSFAAMAAPASATLTGPSAVRAGDTITLTFKLNGENIYGCSGTLAYDDTKLELKGTEQKIASPWMVEFSGTEFVAYDNNLEKPITKSTSLFTLKFKVKSDLQVGDKFTVSLTNVTASDGTTDSSVGTVTYSATIAPPRSGDNSLMILNVSNAALSPAFSKDVTSYTAEVPFDVEKLDVKVGTTDGKAKATVDNPSLKAGGTTNVVITVIAENGAERVYTIQVKRAQDPNYVPSGDNTLSSILLDGYVLSPGFQPDRLEYIVWLPYETDKLTISGTASHPNAAVEVVGGNDLVAGEDNKIEVICTAENGEKKVYTIIAKRAHSHDYSEPTVPAPTEPSLPAPSQPTEPSAPDETVPGPSVPGVDDSPSLFSLPVILAVVAALCVAVGFLAGFLLAKKWNREEQEEDEEDPAAEPVSDDTAAIPYVPMEDVPDADVLIDDAPALPVDDLPEESDVAFSDDFLKELSQKLYEEQTEE